jgi:DNA-binding transcriptional LysR family regulator
MLSAAQILDGDLLAAFAAFAEGLNFSAAARRVGLSQPALFERVRRLGELAGGPLYERSGRAARLTPLGVRLAAFAREALGRGEAMARELRGEAPRDEVTLAAGEGAFLYLLGPALSRFRASGRGLLHLRTLGAAEVARALAAGEADVGLTVLDPVPGGLAGEPAFSAPICAAVPASHRLARRRSVRLVDLASERLVVPPSGRLYRELVARFVAMKGGALEAPIEADGWPLMLEFVRAGLGVAIVNGTCRPPTGVVLRRVAELGVVRYRLLTRRGAELSPAARLLVDLVRGCAAPGPGGGRRPGRAGGPGSARRPPGRGGRAGAPLSSGTSRV